LADALCDGAVPLLLLHQLAAGTDEVDVVLDPARVHVAADADQRPAPEVVDLSQGTAGLGKVEVLALAVARQALPDELVAPRIVRGALLRRPGAGPVAPVLALHVED